MQNQSIGSKIWQSWPSIVAFVIAVLTIIWVIYVFAHRALYITSNNAMVDTDTAALSSQVIGIVRNVNVVAGARVRRGQVLAELDPRPLRSDYEVARSALAGLQSQTDLSEKNLRRAQKLFSQHVISPQDFDNATSANARAQALFLQAKARFEQAVLNLSYTQIIAPGDGVLAFRNAEPGLKISKGQPLFGFIPLKQRWVSAKVRETDLDGIRIGEDVSIRIESYPFKNFIGHVASISQASEVPFSPVRADFAAGNFTKYVQWVPVRISIALNDQERSRIPVGSSCDISMRRHH